MRRLLGGWPVAVASGLAIALVLGPADPACAARRHRKPKAKPVPAEAAPAAPAPVRRGVQPAPPIPLRRNLRFVIRPTLLGLVPPPDPLDMGEAFIRVLGVDEARIVARYEIKDQVAQDPATGDEYLLTQPAAGVKTKPLLRIRRGDVEASRRGEPELLNPLCWTNGNWRTDGGLLWVPGSLLTTLKAGGAPQWQVEIRDDAPDAAGFREVLQQRRTASGVAAQAPLQLKLVQTGAAYRCLVNGAVVDLPAVRAVDSLLLAEYWFLDDPGNALLLKMSYLPLQNPSPAQGGWAGIINSGGGFAVTEIDF